MTRKSSRIIPKSCMKTINQLKEQQMRLYKLFTYKNLLKRLVIKKRPTIGESGLIWHYTSKITKIEKLL